MSQRTERVSNSIKELASNFIAKENNRTSLIDITRVDCSPDLKNATIYISVMPEDKENAALWFIKRNLGEMRKFFKKNMSMKIIPFLDVKIDLGEKNRQRINELLRNDSIS